MIASITCLIGLVAEHDGAEHDLFRQLVGLGLDHQHALAGAGDDQVQLGVGHLVELRVEHVLAVDIADARGRDGAEERDAGNGQRRRGADHRGDVGIVLQVVADRGADHLGFVPIALVEERANRTVDETGGQNLLLGRAPFALEEAAGDLAGREGLFLVVDGEGEEVDPLARGFLADRGGEHRRLAIGDENGPVGLTGDAPGFDGRAYARPI